MKLGIVIASGDAERIWNAFRLGRFSLKKGDEVKVFLVAEGVEAESRDTFRFCVSEEMKSFTDGGGTILASDATLKSRRSRSSPMVPASSVDTLYDIVSSCDHVVTF